MFIIYRQRKEEGSKREWYCGNDNWQDFEMAVLNSDLYMATDEFEKESIVAGAILAAREYTRIYDTAGWDVGYINLEE